MAEITVNITRTINTGNYENIKIELGQTMTVKDGTEGLHEALYNDLKKMIDQKVKEIKKTKKKKKSYD